jgi:hypothetical protein
MRRLEMDSPEVEMEVDVLDEVKGGGEARSALNGPVEEVGKVREGGA